MHLGSNRMANGLARLGLTKGDGLSLVEINSPEFLFSLFGAIKLGAYTVLVNVGLKGESLQYIIDHSDSKAVVIHWTLLDNYRAIRDQLPKVEHVIVDVNETPEGFTLPGGMISLQEVMEGRPRDQARSG
jgi:acyl-CoA synthetase (AMP-forming)/AMP-acid ligase II